MKLSGSFVVEVDRTCLRQDVQEQLIHSALSAALPPGSSVQATVREKSFSIKVSLPPRTKVERTKVVGTLTRTLVQQSVRVILPEASPKETGEPPSSASPPGTSPPEGANGNETSRG